MLRDNASWISIGLIAVAMLLSAAACLGGGESPDVAAPSPLAFRAPTATPSPTPAAVRVISTPGPCPSESGESGPWIKAKGIVICLPHGATLNMQIGECPPVGTHLPCGEIMFHIIERGSSEVRIGVDSGEIVEWDVAPEDEEEFSRLILEPLEKADD